MKTLDDLRFSHLVVGVTDMDRALAGVRMLFVKDPDGTAVEFIEFPNGARTSEDWNRGAR